MRAHFKLPPETELGQPVMQEYTIYSLWSQHRQIHRCATAQHGADIPLEGKT
jgi:hypothetical protein